MSFHSEPAQAFVSRMYKDMGSATLTHGIFRECPTRFALQGVVRRVAQVAGNLLNKELKC